MNLGADVTQLPEGLAVKVTTSPTENAASIENARAFARIDTGLDDSLVSDLMESATQKVEAFLNRKLITQTITANWRVGAPEIKLPFGDVQSVTTVQIGKTDGSFVSATYVLKANTIIFDDSEVASCSDVKIVYVCGMGKDKSDIPGVIKEMIYKLVTTSYDNRENVIVGESVDLMPNNWKTDLAPFISYESF